MFLSFSSAYSQKEKEVEEEEEEEEEEKASGEAVRNAMRECQEFFASPKIFFALFLLQIFCNWQILTLLICQNSKAVLWFRKMSKLLSSQISHVEKRPPIKLNLVVTLHNSFERFLREGFSETF